MCQIRLRGHWMPTTVWNLFCLYSACYSCVRSDWEVIGCLPQSGTFSVCILHVINVSGWTERSLDAYHSLGPFLFVVCMLFMCQALLSSHWMPTTAWELFSLHSACYLSVWLQKMQVSLPVKSGYQLELCEWIQFCQLSYPMSTSLWNITVMYII